MFKRTLSALLAVITVFSSFAVFTVGSSADGFSVSGDVKSMNPNNAATAELKKDGVTVYTTTIAASEGDGEIIQEFEFTGVAADTYDLVVSKAGHLSATVNGVIVDENVDLSDYAINLIPGDIDNDGYIDGTDVSYFVADLGKAAKDALYAGSDINGDTFRDGVDVSVLAFNLLKAATEFDYVDPTPDEPAEDEDEGAYTTVHLHSCDEQLGAFGAGNFSVVKENAPEGTGYYSSTGTSPAVGYASVIAILADVDFTDYMENASIKFKAYVDDLSKSTAIYFTLYDHVENKTTQYEISAESLENGWNDVIIPLNSFKNGGTDVTKIWAIEFASHIKNGETITVGMDDLNILVPVEYETTVLHTCDALMGSWGNGLTVETDDPVEGTGYFSSTADSSSYNAIVADIVDTDFTDYMEDGVLKFHTRITDKTAVEKFAIRFYDKNGGVTDYAIDTDKVGEDWSEVTIKLSDYLTVGTAFANVWAIELYTKAPTKAVTVDWDNLRLSVPKKEAEEGGDENAEVISTMLMNCDKTDGAWTNPDTSIVLKTDDPQEGTGYIALTATQSQTYPAAVFCAHFGGNALDVSAYKKNGTLSFDLYVDDVSKLNIAGEGYANFELYNQDNSKQIVWTLHGKNIVNGWNSLEFPVSDIIRDTGFNYDEAYQFRLFIYLKEGQTVNLGMDNIKMSAVIQKELITQQLNNCDDFTGCWGDGDYHVTEDAPEGTGYVAATGLQVPVICIPFAGAPDISDFKKGYIYLKLYVNDVSKFPSGVNFDIWDISSNVGNIVAWNLLPVQLKNGWNDIKLEFAKGSVGGFDFKALNNIRLYALNADPSGIVGIDDIGIGILKDPTVPKYTITFEAGEGVGDTFTSDPIEEKTDFALPECPFTKDGYEFKGWSNGEIFLPAGYEYYVTEDVTLTALWIEDDGSDAVRDYTNEYVMATAYENSVINEGSANHKAAIAKVMQKAENGEAITVLFLGDSITQGAGGSAGNTYAELVRDWWKNTFPNATVNYINRGIGSTEGMLGAARITNDVLASNPDFVVFDYGTNDYGLPYGQEAFEGIVTQLKAAGVAFLNSNACPRSGNNLESEDAQVNAAYGVPQIGFKSAYLNFTKMENAPEGFSANEVWTSDNVHPSNRGHFLIADLIGHYLDSIYDAYKAGTITPADLDKTLPAAVTANGYANAYLLESNDTTGVCTVEANGFTAYNVNTAHFNTDMDGWKATSAGSSIKFTSDAGYVQLFFYQQAAAGTVEIYVDGTLNTTFTIGSGSWPHQWTNVLHTNDGQSHVIEIKTKTNDPVVITAVGLANFAD